jgi:hypothetical protein
MTPSARHTVVEFTPIAMLKPLHRRLRLGQKHILQ